MSYGADMSVHVYSCSCNLKACFEFLIDGSIPIGTLTSYTPTGACGVLNVLPLRLGLNPKPL